jgi:hypothetical protein
MSNAAIATWILAWTSVRDELRRRCRSAGCKSEWCDQARLLRVLGFSGEYGCAVQAYYKKRRGVNLPFSPLDWLLLEELADVRFAPRAIIRAIGEMFDKRDRAPEPTQINSLQYCFGAMLSEARWLQEAGVGAHDSDDPDLQLMRGSSLLLALPPGRPIFQALQSERQVDAVAEQFQVGIVFTVAPDEYRKHQARERFGVELNFLDPEPPYPDHGLAGHSHSARSRQPFLNQEANG